MVTAFRLAVLLPVPAPAVLNAIVAAVTVSPEANPDAPLKVERFPAVVV